MTAAYEDLSRILERICSSKNVLKDASIDEGSRAENYREGIVNMMLAWDSYVQDLLNGAFDDFITKCSGPQKSLKCLKKQWPSCSCIIKDAMKGKQAYDDLKEADEQSEKYWIELLNTHRRNILDRRAFWPIFDFRTDPKSDEVTIDKAFMKLFEWNKYKMSKLLVEVADDPKVPIHTRERTLMVTLGSANKGLQALSNISRLYYGLYCVFADGKKEKALQGVLKKFRDEEFSLPDQDFRGDKEKTYKDLYKQIEENGRDVQVDYYTILTVADFFLFAAKHLMLAVAKGIRDLQPQNPRDIWKFTFKTPSTAVQPKPHMHV